MQKDLALARIHAAVAGVIKDYAGAFDDLSAADMVTYFEECAQGMKTLAAFRVKGAALADAMEIECDVASRRADAAFQAEHMNR